MFVITQLVWYEFDPINNKAAWAVLEHFSLFVITEALIYKDTHA